jgi:beta-lactamase class A
MTTSPTRRAVLLAAACLPLAPLAARAAQEAPEHAAAAQHLQRQSVQAQFAQLEATLGGRLGVAAIDTAHGARVHYRADERFAFCSTFKVILASAILARSATDAGLLQQRVRYRREDVAHYSPIAERHIQDGMTVAELCAAALQYSDNTSANQLIKLLGGPPAVTAYARTLGSREFRLDRWETALNTAVPGDPRDTATPAAMALSLQRTALGNALPAPQREQLQQWLRGNTTGAHRIRAGVPDGWQVADKTGTGDYGTANDIAVLWPPQRAPIVLAVYHTQRQADAKPHDDMIVAATRVAMGALGAYSSSQPA